MTDPLTEISRRNREAQRLLNEPSPPEPMRPSWPKVWMVVAASIAERSYDKRMKVGAIIVPEDNTGILALGYNGSWKGGPHEPESLEPGKSGMIHAEENALIKAPYHYPLKKHMYLTHCPCRQCSKLMINAGIARVTYDHPYRDTSGLDILRSAGVEVMTLDEAIYVCARDHR